MVSEKDYTDLTAKEQELLRHEARQRCLEDLHYLSKHVLGYNRLTEHVHRDMARDIDTPKYRFKLLLWPRGHFKSTIGTESFGIQTALRAPNARILITNVKLDNARKFLRTISQHFTSNTMFRWVWKQWWIDHYASDFDKMEMGPKLDWITRNVQDELSLLRPYAGREATFTTGAVDASMVSQHYSHIIADDLINRDYVRTQEMVEKSILYFKDLLDLLDSDGTLMVIGTRWSHMDLYSWIIEEFGRKASFRVPEHIAESGSMQSAIQSSHETTEEEKDWMISVRPTSVEYPIFPEEYSSKVLRSLMEAKGPYEYGAQYELNPTPAAHQKFREEWFLPMPEHATSTDWLASLTACITVDPAISLEGTADNSAIIVCGYDDRNKMYLLDGLNEKVTEDQLLEAVFDMVRKWTLKVRFVLPVGFESVGFQQLYLYNLERMMLERDFFFAVEPIKRGAMSKEERILRLVPRLKHGFYMPKSMEKEPFSGEGQPYDLVQRLKWELLKFPFAGKKDIADALADQLDIVKAHRLPSEDTTDEKVVKVDFTHQSMREDRKKLGRQKASRYNDAVRS